MKKILLIIFMIVLVMGVNGIDKKELKKQCRVDCVTIYKSDIKICNGFDNRLCNFVCKKSNKTCIQEYNKCLNLKKSMKKGCINEFSLKKEQCFWSCRKFECSGLYKPICGIDGLTYSNECFLKLAEIRKRHDGKCEAFCNDTDGKDIAVRGRVLITNLSSSNISNDLAYYDDGCVDLSLNQPINSVSECRPNTECRLKEYYCNNHNFSFEYVDCPYGCKEGACLRNTEPIMPNPINLYVFREGETKMILIDDIEYKVTNIIITDTGNLYVIFVIDDLNSGKLMEKDIFKFREDAIIKVIKISPSEEGDLTSDIVSIAFESIS